MKEHWIVKLWHWIVKSVFSCSSSWRRYYVLFEAACVSSCHYSKRQIHPLLSYFIILRKVKVILRWRLWSITERLSWLAYFARRPCDEVWEKWLYWCSVCGAAVLPRQVTVWGRCRVARTPWPTQRHRHLFYLWFIVSYPILFVMHGCHHHQHQHQHHYQRRHQYHHHHIIPASPWTPSSQP